MPNVAEQSLCEQLKITDREIESRKRLLGFDDDDATRLASCKPLVTADLERIVEDFYAIQISIPEVALVIGDADTLAHLKAAMRRYVAELFEGCYDTGYVNKRLRIGKVHQRIGVSPKLYIAALHHLEQRLMQTLAGQNDKVRASLRRIMAFDQQLVFDTYISGLTTQVEAARREAEQYAAQLEEVVAERTRALEELSRRDQLTGLLNQRAFYEAVRRELAQAERHGQPLTLVYIDLDGFKAVNDGQGHQQGDEVLRDMGAAMTESVREGDYACRYGGDEFCVVLPRTTADDARPVCERMIEAFRKRRGDEVMFSLGVAQTGPDDFATVDQLVRCADKRMYAAKEEGRRAPGFHMCLSRSAGEGERPPVSRLRKKAG